MRGDRGERASSGDRAFLLAGERRNGEPFRGRPVVSNGLGEPQAVPARGSLGDLGEPVGEALAGALPSERSMEDEILAWWQKSLPYESNKSISNSAAVPKLGLLRTIIA
jgi:hypothetical protein